MPTSTLDDIVAQFQKSILRNERKAASEMVRVYVEGWKRIRTKLERLQAEYDRTLERGETPSLNWIYQNNRLADMQELIGKELRRFSNYAVGAISDEQAQVIAKSLGFSRDTLILQLGPEYDVPGNLRVKSLPVQDVIAMVGANQPGSPLMSLFDKIKTDGAQQASDVLIEGMMLGYNPRKVAPMIRDALGVQLNRALTISRTEMARAQRAATEANYKANADIVKGWRWMAEVNGACPVCLAMHGTEHPLSEKMSSHPNCRCCESPITMSWEEIGAQYGVDLSGVGGAGPSFEEVAKKYNMTPEQIARYEQRNMTGEAYFRTLSAEDQRNLLGPAKWLAWKEGKFGFDQLVKKTYSAAWGEGKGVASLKDLLGEEDANHYRLLAQWNKNNNWEETERKTVGLSFLSGDLSLKSIEEARALGLSEEGWAKYREDFNEKWLKPYELVDDLIDTIGYWKGPEPSFNLKVFGSINNVEKFADAWGAQFNQQSMGILTPDPNGEGGKFVWDFGETLTDGQMNQLFNGLDVLNSVEEVNKANVVLGLTTFGSKRMEFWYRTELESRLVNTYLQNLIDSFGDIKNRNQIYGYKFYFREQGTNY